MFTSILEILKSIFISDFFFECFSMVWTVGIVSLVFFLIRRL